MPSLPVTLVIFSLTWLGYAATSDQLLAESEARKHLQPLGELITVTGDRVPNGRVLRQEKICMKETLTGCVDARTAQQVAKSDGTTEIYIEGTNTKRVRELEGSLSSPLK